MKIQKTVTIVFLTFLGLPAILIAGPNEDLLKAAWDDDLAKVKTALSQGADPNAKDVFGESALHKTTSKSKTEIAELLIQKGANVNATDGKGRTPLMKTFFQSMVKFLLEKGADINLKDEKDWTAVLHQTSYGTTNLEVIESLVAKGAAIQVQGKDGVTPLMLACKNDNTQLIDFYIQKGLDVNAKDGTGKTVLMYAAEGPSKPDLIQMLLKKGANKATKNTAGKTAFDLASERSATFEPYIQYKKEVAKLLK
ncbi:ankyrin repeat domain-containing protein [Leptospira sp. WS92.C1]